MKSIKSLYMTDYQLRELALFVAGETPARWQTSPRNLLELEMRFSALAEVAPHAGKITIVGDVEDYDGENEPKTYTLQWESPRALLLAAAKVCNEQAAGKLRSAMALFKDIVDPQISPDRTVTVRCEERD